MAKAHTEWTVLPHDPIETIAENLWRVEGDLPKPGLRRVMTVARLADGRLVIHNAIALDDEEMARLEAWGEPAFLVVPNGWHRLDAAIFKARYPKIRVLAPAGSRKLVEQVLAVEGGIDEVTAAGDPGVSMEHLEGLKEKEGVLRVTSGEQATLVFNDAIFNLPHGKGFFGLVFRVMGSTGGAKVSPLFKMMAVKDKKAYATHLARLAATPGLNRLIMSHGAMIEEDAAKVLAEVALAV